MSRVWAGQVQSSVVASLVVALGGAGAGANRAARTTGRAAGADAADGSAARLRRSIYVMEGALARAVEFGAKDLNRKMRSAMPEMMALSGEPQARGVYLEGYGIYFDVSVPVLNQVMMWSWGRMLGTGRQRVAALNEIKSYVQMRRTPPSARRSNDMLGRIELQLGPVASPSNPNDGLGAGPRPAPGAAMVSPNVTTVPPPAQTAPP